MRSLMNIAEMFNLDRGQLDAPDIAGLVDIHWLGEMLSVKEPITFYNAMRKILTNRSEDMNDFEIFEVADAFVNFIGLSPEDRMRLVQRLSIVHTVPGGHIPDVDVTDEEPKL